jgi:hypothetical protein
VVLHKLYLSTLNVFFLVHEPDSSGIISSSSISDDEQSQAQTQNKVIQSGERIEIQHQGNQPIEIREIKSTQNDNGVEMKGIQGTGDSSSSTNNFYINSFFF